MRNNIAAFIAGVVFSLGLGISGMTRPEKIIGFLDIFGPWDASLAFVMIGAIGIHAVAYRWIRRRKSPLYSKDFHVPSAKEITPSLVIGAIIFGVGWGLAGYCPGPAITSIVSLQFAPILFVGSMILGMVVFRLYEKGLQLFLSKLD